MISPYLKKRVQVATPTARALKPGRASSVLHDPVSALTASLVEEHSRSNEEVVKLTSLSATRIMTANHQCIAAWAQLASGDYEEVGECARLMVSVQTNFKHVKGRL